MTLPTDKNINPIPANESVDWQQIERERRSRFTLVVTFDGDESNACLERVQQTIAYLRGRGWTVEEQDA